MPRAPLNFTKMSGAGNDFILLDHRRRHLFPEPAAAQRFAKAVCERKFSVGADGLILIEEAQGADFRWQFFNADGSIAEMCGNGARCAARFAHQRGIAPARMKFLTLAGMIEAEVTGTGVALTMTPPRDCRLNLQLAAPDGAEITLHSVDTGVPHAVIFCADIEQAPVREWGRHFRFHPHFAPAGTNLNLVGLVGDNLLKVRTYERGVEDETLACGTGAVASALVAARLGRVSSPTRIITSGREELVIHYRLEREDFSQVRLEGPADFIYDGALHPEALRRG